MSVRVLPELFVNKWQTVKTSLILLFKQIHILKFFNLRETLKRAINSQNTTIII